MDKIKSIVTGDAYSKPAKTEAGALTTQGSDDAHTTEGTSANDSSIPGTGTLDKTVDQGVDSAATKAGVPQSADSTINKEVNKQL